MVVSGRHPTYWQTQRAYVAQAWATSRQAAPGGSSARAAVSTHTRVRGEAVRPYGGSSVVSARLRACEQAPRLASPNPSPARSLGRSRRPRNWDTEALPVCPSHRDAYAPSSQAQPVSVDTTTSRPVARAPALPPAPRRTCADRVCASGGSAASRPHARTAEPRARKPPREGCGARAVSTSSPDSEVVLGDPGLRPSPPYPQKVPPPPPGLPPWPRATLTLFGAPAGRSVFSLPAGPDANVEKDGSSASLTAMSDSPGGCLWAGWGAHGGRSQGPTLDHHSGVSHPGPHPSLRPALHLPH